MTADETWRQVAEDTREALALVGYPISPRCLPGEPEACGGSWAQHAAAHFGTLQAVADHQLDHLGPDLAGMADDVRAHALAELRVNCLSEHPGESR